MTAMWPRALRVIGIVGPGIIVMTGDNDVGAFALYTSAGALYGSTSSG